MTWGGRKDDMRAEKGTEKMTWEELQAVKHHQHYDSYYEAN